MAVAITCACWWEHDQLCRRQRQSQKQERRLINTVPISKITKKRSKQTVEHCKVTKWRKIRAKISSNIFITMLRGNNRIVILKKQRGKKHFIYNTEGKCKLISVRHT